MSVTVETTTIRDEHARTLPLEPIHPGDDVATKSGRVARLMAALRSRSLLVPIGGVTGILLLCKAIGFSEKIVVAHYLGTSSEADAYYAAFAVVWTIVFMFRELLQPSFMPVYLQAVQSDCRLAQRLATAVIVLMTAATVGVALVLMFASQWVAGLAAPGFEVAVRLRIAELLSVMSGGVAALTFMGLTGVLLNAHRRFCWAAIGDFVFRSTLVAGLAAGFKWAGGNYVGSALAAGAALGVAVHVLVLSRHIRPCVPRLDCDTRRELARVVLLAAPLAFGVLSSHIGHLIDGVLASMLAPGRLSGLSYARKLTDAIVLLGPVALTTVMFAHFASLAAEGRLDQMRSLLVRCVRIVLVVSTPVAILVVCQRELLVRILFQHGRFSSQSTDLTAVALAGYGMGLVAFALDGLIVGTFYAMRQMKTPVLLGVLGVILEILIAWAFMHSLDHLAIAFAASASKILKVSLLWWLLMRRLEMRPTPDGYRLLMGLVLAGIAMAITVEGAGFGWTWLPVQTGRMADLLGLAATSTLGVVTFALVAACIGVAELRQGAGRVRAIISNRGSMLGGSIQ